MRASNILAAALATGAMTGVAANAAAQEYCVSCVQPQATYRCVIGDARLAGGQPLQEFCVSTLTKEGGHQSCRVKPGTVFDCDGPVKRLATQPKASMQKPAASAQDRAVPATVDRLAEDVVRSSEEKAEKAGEKITSGAKDAWSCVLSFFKSC